MIEIDRVQVIDKGLRVVKEVELPEEVGWVGGRSGVGVRSGLWYKGIGTLYTCHFVKDRANMCVVLDRGLYGGWVVQYRPWVNRFGIFQERMQWYFTEWIGGAGKREAKIIRNADEFAFSAVRVVDVIPVMDEHNVYVLEVRGGKGVCWDVGKVMKLLDVMLSGGWNFPWDKGAIRDINGEGLVTDVADLFKSDDVKHKFGTVYSVLYSMVMFLPDIAEEFGRRFGVSLEIKELPFSVLKVMKRLGCDVSEIWEGKVKWSWEGYKYLVLDVLMEGVNCAGLEFPEYGEEVKNWYKKEFLVRCGDAQVPAGQEWCSNNQLQ
jgi:hypothetical protein